MDVRLAEGEGPGFPEAYLQSVGRQRAAAITLRLDILKRVHTEKMLISPTFEPLGDGFEGLWQIAVRFDQETHRIVFCKQEGEWVLVYALRAENDIPFLDKKLAAERCAALRSG